MTTPAWPFSDDYMISPVGYKEGVYAEPTVRSSVDSGPPKMRPRFTAVAITITGQIEVLTSDDVDTLMTFHDTTLAFGSLPFTWVHPRTGAGATMQFVKRPETSTSGNSPTVFTATLNLIILPT